MHSCIASSSRDTKHHLRLMNLDSLSSALISLHIYSTDGRSFLFRTYSLNDGGLSLQPTLLLPETAGLKCHVPSRHYSIRYSMRCFLKPIFSSTIQHRALSPFSFPFFWPWQARQDTEQPANIFMTLGSASAGCHGHRYGESIAARRCCCIWWQGTYHHIATLISFLVREFHQASQHWSVILT